jgi:hypothetical protein
MRAAVAAVRDKLRATLPTAREKRVLGAQAGTCPPAGAGRALLPALTTAAALALPAVAGAQAPPNCVTSGSTGDPIQDCYHQTGIGETGPFQRFVAEWSAPRVVAVEVPGVPPVTCRLTAEEHIFLPSVWSVIYAFCDNPVPPSLTFAVTARNGGLTPTGTYYYSEQSITCTGERSCYAPEVLLGGSSGATYRALGRFTITAPGITVGTTPWCVRDRPDTITCWAADTQPAVNR